MVRPAPRTAALSASVCECRSQPCKTSTVKGRKAQCKCSWFTLEGILWQDINIMLLCLYNWEATRVYISLCQEVGLFEDFRSTVSLVRCLLTDHLFLAVNRNLSPFESFDPFECWNLKDYWTLFAHLLSMTWHFSHFYLSVCVAGGQICLAKSKQGVLEQPPPSHQDCTVKRGMEGPLNQY